MTPTARTRTRALPGVAALLACGLLAAGCRPDGGDEVTNASAADRAACAQHADQVFRLRNPDVVYRDDTYVSSTRDTPFNGAGLSSVPTRGLGGDYARDELLRHCLNGGGGTAPDAPMPEEAPAAAAPAPAQP